MTPRRTREIRVARFGTFSETAGMPERDIRDIFEEACRRGLDLGRRFTCCWSRDVIEFEQEIA